MTTPEPNTWCKFEDGCHRVVPCDPGCAVTGAAMYEQLAAVSGVQPDTREHHTVDGVRHLCHTDDHYCPSDTRPVPDTERRERWAAAIAKAAGSKAFAKTGPEWDHARGAWGLHADAAMAVADEEQREFRATVTHAMRTTNNRNQDLMATVDRLRAELEAATERLGFMDRNTIPDLHRRLEASRDTVARWRGRAETAEAEQEQARTLLTRAESYLSALHGSVARHDNLGAGLGCAGCELRDQITAELRDLTAAAPGGQVEDAHPESTAWNAEFWEIDRWMSFGTSPERARMEQHLASLRARNPEADTRLVRATTTYTVEQAEDGAQPATTVDPDVVAYRNSHQPGVLLCRGHGFGWAGLTPLTSEDLPDGGTCTFGDPGDPDDRCGVDVLIPQPGPTTEDGAQQK